MNEKYKYLGKNTAIFAISSFGTKILSFLLVPLYTAILTTAEYGIADLITTTATLLVPILTINIASSVLRFTLDQKIQKCNILSFGFRVLVIGTFSCGIILEILYTTNLLTWSIENYIFIFLYFFATALYEIMTNYLRAIDQVKDVAIAGILSSITILLGNILFLVVLGAGVIGYLISLTLGPLLASIFCILVAKAPLKTYIFVDCDCKLKREMVIYSIPLIFNNVALWINAFLDRYFVTYYCGVSENGIYSVAGKIPTILSTCCSIFASAWTLSAIKEFDPNDTDGFFSNTYNAYGALMTIACSGIILLNIPIAHFLFSNQFFLAWQYSSVLLLSVLFNTLTVFQGSIFSATKKTNVIAVTTVISAVVNIILNALLIPALGALGAAIATTVAYFTMWLVRYIALRKFIVMKINLIKDFLIYGIITLQIVFEHLTGHLYVGQLICITTVVLINRKYLKIIMDVFTRKFLHGNK